MSKVAKTVGAVAGILSIVLIPINPGLAAVMAAVATVANTIAVVTQKKPTLKGSVSQIVIGATMPIPYAMGRTFAGGMQVYDNSGADGNARRWQIMVVSAAGPIDSYEKMLVDYAEVTFDAGLEANGWYDNYLFKWQQLGNRPEIVYTDEHTMPGWGSQSKLSGYANYKVKMRFDKDGKRFASGVPQFGMVFKGVKVYDPRLDSTYPGGVGGHRWDDELTWEWSDNPALHGLAYARGRYIEKNALGVALDPPIKLLGFGLRDRPEAIDIAGFVEHANICEANGWAIGGTVYEAPDMSKWDNLKRILQSGGAQPVWAGGLLRLRVSTPRTSLFNITADDLASGDVEVTAMKSWRERRNSIVPKYRAEDHKWEYVQGDAVTASTYLEEDGELKTEEVQFDLVQDKDQAAQLAAYEMVNAREFGPITVTVKPRLLAYRVGECGTIHIPEAGLFEQLAVITGRSVDPATGSVTLVLESETTAKHAYALGQTGTAPPTPVIRSSEELDEGAAVGTGVDAQNGLLVATSYTRGLSLSINAAGALTVSNHDRVYSDKIVAVTGATATPTSVAAGDKVGVFYDDPTREGGAVTLQHQVFPGGVGDVDGINYSATNPFRHFLAMMTVPASGSTSGGSGSGSGGGSGGPSGGGGGDILY